MTLGQFFTLDDEFSDLTDNQKHILTMWNSMSDLDRKLVIAYMEGLTAKLEQDK